jgi:CheY-like chemotaxis protein
MERRGVVVVLEDNADTRTALSEILQLEGYDVFATPDGMEALERLKIVPRPCVVLLDLHLAGMSGADFYRRQQSDPALASIPVIAVTAAPPDQRVGLGSIPVIRKPIDLDELRFAIDRVTSRDKKAGPAS